MGNLREKIIGSLFKPDLVIGVCMTVLLAVVVGFNACSPPTPQKTGTFSDVKKVFSSLTDSATISCACRNGAPKGVFSFFDDCERLCQTSPNNGYTHAVYEIYAPFGTLDQFCRSNGDNGVIPTGCTGDISSSSRNGSMQIFISGFNGFQNIISFQIPSSYENESSASINLTELKYNQSYPPGEIDLEAELDGYKPGHEEVFIYVCHQLANNPEYVPNDSGIYPDYNPGNQSTWPRVRHGEPYALYTSTAFSKNLNCNGINKDPIHTSAPYVINTFNTNYGTMAQDIGYGSGTIGAGTLKVGSQQNPPSGGVNLLDIGYKSSLGSSASLSMYFHRASNPFPFLPMNLLSSINGSVIQNNRVGTVLKAQKVSNGVYSCEFAKNLILDGQNLHHVTFRIMQNTKNSNEYLLQPLWSTRWGQPSSGASGQGPYSGKTYSQILNDKSPLLAPWRSDTLGVTNKEFTEHTPGSYYCAIDKVQ